MKKIYDFLKKTLMHPTWGSIIVILVTLSMTLGLVNTGVILLKVLDSILHYLL
jgi:hypothetical protein